MTHPAPSSVDASRAGELRGSDEILAAEHALGLDPDTLAAQPVRRVVRDNVEYVLLGTAHVSRASAEAVRQLAASEPFDAIAVELCAPRAQALLNPDAVASLDLWQVIREGRAAVVGAGLALGAYQRRLAKQFGIEPGEEMRVAIERATARGVPHWLVDRDVGVTLRRTRAAVGFWERTKITAGLFASVLDDSEIEEASIESLKKGDMLSGTFSEFAQQSPALYDRIIAERDRYMAARLREESSRAGFDSADPFAPRRRVLAVVGAGHLDGLERHLAEAREAPAELLAPLRAEPPPSALGKWFGYAVIALIVGGIAWGFTQSKTVGIDLIWIWVVSTFVGGAVGAVAALGHPLSVLAAAAVSPLSPLHPALSSGMVSGAVELLLRKPRVGDFESLRNDVVSPRGWYRNRVSRVLLVFLLTNLGTALSVWVAGILIARRAAE